MVTRAPLSVQLIYTPDAAAMRAEFGEFVDGGWAIDQSISLACPVSLTRMEPRTRSPVDGALAQPGS